MNNDDRQKVLDLNVISVVNLDQARTSASIGGGRRSSLGCFGTRIYWKWLAMRRGAKSAG
jgi:hypothetical protein